MQHMKITPTVGRVVWFYPSTRTGSSAFHPPTLNDPLAAIVAKVIGAHFVNLAVFDAHGFTHSMIEVPLVQEGEDAPAEGYYATWMPHQIGQAKKHDAKLPGTHPVQQLADAVGGTLEHVERLPDGTGAAVLSMPLPADHWLTKPGYNVPPMVFRKGTDDPERQEWAEKIRAAGRYAVRCATINGTENDFDPDALVQNLVVGMLGYWTPDGLSSDADANPPGLAA
jgi:hypothetical protein